MPKHTIALWLLRCALPRSHAEVLLGDLLEIAGNNSNKTMPRLLVETMWSLLSRSIAGFLLAAIVGGSGMVAMQTMFFDSLALHPATSFQRAWGSTLAALAGCLFIMTVYSVVRYGALDRMSRISSACIVALAAAALLWWVPGITPLSELLLLAILLVSLLGRDSRSAVLAVLVLLALQFTLWFGGIGMLLAPLARLWRHAPADATALRSFVFTAFSICYALLILLVCVTYAKVRRWVFA